MLMSRRHTKLLSTLIVLAISAFVFTIQTPTSTLNTTHTPSRIPPGFYKVTEVYDGDTIGVDMEGTVEKVRFIGVDTPETHDPRKAVQCYGTAASEYTAKLIGYEPVRLEADPTNSNRDRYQRLLRYVYLPDGKLINAEIIKEGYGFAYTAFPFTKLEEFRAYELLAKEQNKGLWGVCSIQTESNGSIHTGDAF